MKPGLQSREGAIADPCSSPRVCKGICNAKPEPQTHGCIVNSQMKFVLKWQFLSERVYENKICPTNTKLAFLTCFLSKIKKFSVKTLFFLSMSQQEPKFYFTDWENSLINTMGWSDKSRTQSSLGMRVHRNSYLIPFSISPLLHITQEG
jgi:hypothetical protein